MNVVDKIREQYKTNMMQELVAKPHRKRILHLDDVRSIGVIAHGLSDTEQITLSQFTHHMTNRGSMVRKIELPVNADELLDKYGLPKPDFMQLFISYHYDVLIDTTTGNDLYGPYVTLNTSSSLRVGYGGEPPAATADAEPQPGKIYQDIYDLIILGKSPYELSQYLTNILEYLVMIKKNKE